MERGNLRLVGRDHPARHRAVELVLDTARHQPPIHVTQGQLGDGAYVAKVRGPDGVTEAGGGRTVSVELLAVADGAVRLVERLAFGDILGAPGSRGRRPVGDLYPAQHLLSDGRVPLEDFDRRCVLRPHRVIRPPSGEQGQRRQDHPALDTQSRALALGANEEAPEACDAIVVEAEVYDDPENDEPHVQKHDALRDHRSNQLEQNEDDDHDQQRADGKRHGNATSALRLHGHCATSAPTRKRLSV